MDSVKAVRYQATEVCDALEELAECTDDAQGKSEAESLVSQMRSYKFWLHWFSGTLYCFK